jgi:hypothetical protein
MIDNSSHIFDFSDFPEWLSALKEGKNEYVLQTYFQKNKHFTQLSFSSCGLTDPDLKIILAIIQKCPHIQSLNLANNQFSKEGVLYLAGKLAKLELDELDVSGNYKVGCDAIEALVRAIKHSTLRILKLNRIPLNGSCDAIFKELKESRVVHFKMSTTALAASDAPAIATHLKEWANLESLDLASNLFGDEGIDLIIRAASKLNLRELNIGYNFLTSDILARLGQQFTDTSLTTVHYDGVDLPPAKHAILNSAVLFNAQYNQPAQLSLAAQAGGQLKLQEQETHTNLPPELAETIGSLSTESQTQKRAFMQGWSEQGAKFSL